MHFEDVNKLAFPVLDSRVQVFSNCCVGTGALSLFLSCWAGREGVRCKLRKVENKPYRPHPRTGFGPVPLAWYVSLFSGKSHLISLS